MTTPKELALEEELRQMKRLLEFIMARADLAPADLPDNLAGFLTVYEFEQKPTAGPELIEEVRFVKGVAWTVEFHNKYRDQIGVKGAIYNHPNFFHIAYYVDPLLLLKRDAPRDLFGVLSSLHQDHVLKRLAHEFK